MKARAINWKELGIVLAILTAFLSCGVAWADYHNGYDCEDCHDMHGGTTNASLIAQCVPWLPPDSPPCTTGREVVFAGLEDPWDYDDQVEYKGICQVCHVYTKYYTYDGLCDDGLGGRETCEKDHPEFEFESYTGGLPGTDCMQCHSHCNQFSHCSDPQAGCHASQSHATHTDGTAKGPDPLVCDDCHTVASGDPYNANDMAANGNCNPCHSPNGAFDGVNDPDIGAKNCWNDVYEADNVTLKAGKEKWCAGCHDGELSGDPAYSKPVESAGAVMVIVDNTYPEASYTGTWGTSSWAPGYYGTNYHFHGAAAGTETFTWTPSIDTPGTYEVFARWAHSTPAPDTTRAANATYTVYDDSGSTPVVKDQQYSAGQWVSLGTFEFDGTGVEKVELVQNASGIVVADAIMIVPPSDETIVDNPGGTPTGTWGTSSWCPGAYGTNYRFHSAAAGTDYFTWPVTVTISGTYEVWARWATCGDPDTSRADDATYTVYDDSGSTPVVKDQQYSRGQWVSLGTFDFDGAGVEKVELAQSASGIVVADAIKLTPPSEDILVDNPDGTADGTWGTSSWCDKRIGNNYRFHAAGAGSEKFTWTATIPSAGTYAVLAYWCDDPNRAPDATYTIYHNGGSTVVSRDQRASGEWVLLGDYEFAAGDADVELVQSANGVVIADAIKWSPDLSAGGIYAPNVIGDDTQTYGFYKTGHAKNSDTNCLDCHDASKEHIDHTHRTYMSAADNYQAGYRLAKSMVVPRPGRGDLWAYLDDFALCGDCHNLYEVLGQNEGDVSHSNFWDDDGSPKNTHPYHIKGTHVHFDSDWDGVNDSTQTCIACHNVHGPPNQAMIRHGELISTYGTTDKAPGLNFCYLTSLSPDVCDTDADLQLSVGSKIAPNTALSEFVCNGCHSGRKLERDPYLGPKVLTGRTDPDPAPPDGTTNVTLTVFVLDHNDNVSSVTIDVSPILGAGYESEAMVPEGNGIYSYQLTVPDTVADGIKSLFVEADDPDGPTGTNYLVVNVKNPAIIDNEDAEAGFTGTWGTSSYSPGYYGTNYHYHAAAGGTDTFTWTPTTATIPSAGTYEVWARWANSGANPDPSRADDATYTVYHDGGSTPVSKDQQYQGGQWVSLGTFDFDGTGVEKVELVQSASKWILESSDQNINAPRTRSTKKQKAELPSDQT